MNRLKVATLPGAFIAGLLCSVAFSSLTSRSWSLRSHAAEERSAPARKPIPVRSEAVPAGQLPRQFLSNDQWKRFLDPMGATGRERLTSEADAGFWREAETAHSWLFRAFPATGDAAHWSQILQHVGIIRGNDRLRAETSDFLLGWAYAGGSLHARSDSSASTSSIPKEQWPIAWELRALLGSGERLEDDLQEIKAAELPDELRYECRWACLTGWSLRDPVAVLGWSQLDRRNAWDAPAGQVLLAAAAAGPKRLQEVMRKAVASTPVDALAKAWQLLERPPAALIAFLKSLDPTRRSEFLKRFTLYLAESSLSTISKFIAEAPDELLSPEFVAGLGTTVLSRNPEEFTNLTRALKEGERNKALDNALYHTFTGWAPAGRYYVAHRTITDAPPEMLEHAVAQIAYDNLSEALALPFVRDGKLPSLTRAAYESHLFQLGGHPEQIVPFLDSLPEGTRESLLRESVTRFEPNQAVKLLEEAHAGDAAWVAFLDNARLPSEEIADLLRIRLEKGASPEFYAKTVGKFMETLTREDDAAALATLQTLPDSPARDAGTASYVGELGKFDALRAISLVEALAPGPVRNRCIEQLLPSLAFSSALTQRVSSLAVPAPSSTLPAP